jgi:dTDP-4-amino-4,6-dideoxygalactose transaminase
MVGWNARMDGFQGAVLSVKLKYIDSWNASRRENAATYGRFLAAGADGLILPVEADYAKHIYHIYAVRMKDRDTLMDALGKKGIATGIHYPIPLHLTGAYRSLGYKEGDFPVAERCASEFISFPMFPELTEEQIHYVADAIKEWKKE